MTPQSHYFEFLFANKHNTQYIQLTPQFYTTPTGDPTLEWDYEDHEENGHQAIWSPVPERLQGRRVIPSSTINTTTGQQSSPSSPSTHTTQPMSTEYTNVIDNEQSAVNPSTISSPSLPQEQQQEHESPSSTSTLSHVKINTQTQATSTPKLKWSSDSTDGHITLSNFGIPYPHTNTTPNVTENDLEIDDWPESDPESPYWELRRERLLIHAENRRKRLLQVNADDDDDDDARDSVESMMLTMSVPHPDTFVDLLMVMYGLVSEKDVDAWETEDGERYEKLVKNAEALDVFIY
ncbi:hypothetical protein HDU76_002959 [Blyttiomyces sp. JEL0837]|nr:hypothetical protein HDU76_002959 [Blyttiomyces sp. JEL0837]